MRMSPERRKEIRKMAVKVDTEFPRTVQPMASLPALELIKLIDDLNDTEFELNKRFNGNKRRAWIHHSGRIYIQATEKATDVRLENGSWAESSTVDEVSNDIQ